MTMREKRGFWFDSKTLEVIPVQDHYDFLEGLDRKVRFGFEMTADDKRWAKSLDMTPPGGWLELVKARPSKVKRDFLIAAMKRGWVRIRGHSDMPRVTFEFWKKNSGMMAALAVAAKQVARPNETLELHEVSSDTPWLVSAKELMGLADEGGELADPGTSFMRELWGRTVEPNKGKKRRGAMTKVSKNPLCSGAVKAHGIIPMRGGAFCYRQSGPAMSFSPDKSDIKFNPVDTEIYGRPTYARLVVGFRVGRKVGNRLPPTRKFVTMADVKHVLLDTNDYQTAGGNRPLAGYTLVPQIGLYVPKKLKDKSAAEMSARQLRQFDEPGVQVLLFRECSKDPQKTESWAEYFERINRVGYTLLRDLGQEAVLVEVVVNGQFLVSAAWAWSGKTVDIHPQVPFAQLARKFGVKLGK